MDSSGQFWVRIVQIVMVGFVLIISSCSVKDYYSERNVVESIQAGASPIAARCAIYGLGEGGNRQLICYEARKQ